MATLKHRELLKKAGPNKQWEKKVDKMPEEQVIAMFKRLKQQKKI